jgi:hypothetical protein
MNRAGMNDIVLAGHQEHFSPLRMRMRQAQIQAAPAVPSKKLFWNSGKTPQDET